MKIKVKLNRDSLITIKSGDMVECKEGFDIHECSGGARYKAGDRFIVKYITEVYKDSPTNWIFWDTGGKGCYGRAIRKVVDK